MSRTCEAEGCDRRFEPKRRDSRHCSKRCKNRAYRDATRKPPPPRECQNPDCGRSFTPKRRSQKYCCDRCNEHAKYLRSRAAGTRSRSPGAQAKRGYTEWNPPASYRVLLGQIQGVLAEYEAHLPLTIRQVFYRLVAGGYAKTIESYRRVQRCLALARRAEMIPFPSIRDDGASYAPGAGERYGNTSPAGYVSGVEQELRDLLSWNHYRRGAHEGQPYEIEVWCEAAGMIPQLSRVVAPYGVGAYSCGGYDSVTEKKKGAERYAQRDVPTVLLHVGDYDKDGLQIFDALVEDIEAFIRRDGGEFEAVRVAITPEQIEEYGLPSFKGAVQAEALPPDALARLVEAAVLEYYDLDIAAKVRERERAERTEVDRLLAELRERVQLPDEDSDGQA